MQDRPDTLCPPCSLVQLFIQYNSIQFNFNNKCFDLNEIYWNKNQRKENKNTVVLLWNNKKKRKSFVDIQKFLKQECVHIDWYKDGQNGYNRIQGTVNDSCRHVTAPVWCNQVQRKKERKRTNERMSTTISTITIQARKCLRLACPTTPASHHWHHHHRLRCRCRPKKTVSISIVIIGKKEEKTKRKKATFEWTWIYASVNMWFVPWIWIENNWKISTRIATFWSTIESTTTKHSSIYL